MATNALTIALKTAAGSDASSANPIDIAFRSSTSATGTKNIRQVTGALSVVVSSGSTLGHEDNKNRYMYIYALDNAGSVELAVSSTLFDDGQVQSSTAEGGGGSADSDSTLYSTTSRASVPLRLLARLRSTQATAGTWAAVPTEIATPPFAGWGSTTETPWVKFTPAWTASVSNPSIGDGNLTGYWKRIGDTLFSRGYIAVGSTTSAGSGDYSFGLPSGLTIDTTKLTTGSDINTTLGEMTFHDTGVNIHVGRVAYATTTTVKLYRHSVSGGLTVREGSPVGSSFGISNGDEIFWEFSVPIVEWG